MKGSKTQKGGNYAERDEKYEKKAKKKTAKSMRTAGLATLMKKSEKEEGYAKPRLPKVKPTIKRKGLIK